jgi:hypothetical protein
MKWLLLAKQLNFKGSQGEKPTHSGVRYRHLKKERASLFERRPLSVVCPADAVLAKLPFPSKQGWITVGALLTSNQGLSLNRAQPSLHGINHIGFGALARNPEHRRAKYMFLPWKVLQKVKRTITREVSPQDVLQATFLVFGVRRSLRLG